MDGLRDVWWEIELEREWAAAAPTRCAARPACDRGARRRRPRDRHDDAPPAGRTAVAAERADYPGGVILAIDTSLGTAVAVVEDDGVVRSRASRAPTARSRRGDRRAASQQALAEASVAAAATSRMSPPAWARARSPGCGSASPPRARSRSAAASRSSRSSSHDAVALEPAHGPRDRRPTRAVRRRTDARRREFASPCTAGSTTTASGAAGRARARPARRVDAVLDARRRRVAMPSARRALGMLAESRRAPVGPRVARRRPLPALAGRHAVAGPKRVTDVTLPGSRRRSSRQHDARAPRLDDLGRRSWRSSARRSRPTPGPTR